MLEVAVLGLGAWSPDFANIQELLADVQAAGGPRRQSSEKPPLSPAMLPPRERRRAPQTVKMALEVMGQAISDCGIASELIAVVTASAMGDMEIIDYMCRTAEQNPRLISPTSFHNSVHNSAVGYWSISQSSHATCSAVAAGEYSGSAGLLEAVVLCLDTQGPVLLVIQEGLAPAPLRIACESPRPLSLALLLTPAAEVVDQKHLAHLRIKVEEQTASWPALPAELETAFGGNPAGKMLPLFVELARSADAKLDQPALRQSDPSQAGQATFQLPLTPRSRLMVHLQSRRADVS